MKKPAFGYAKTMVQISRAAVSFIFRCPESADSVNRMLTLYYLIMSICNFSDFPLQFRGHDFV